MRKSLFFASFVAAMFALPHLALAEERSPGEELQAAIARAGEFRGKAGDFGAEAYFPSEWEAAKALYERAAAMFTATDDVGGAIAGYNAAADSFASLFRLSVPLYAQAREDEIMMIRDGLVAAGARAFFPELFGPADRAAVVALEQYEAGEYHAARDSAATAYAMFRVLETAFGAWQTRREIIRRWFTDYARDNFDRAEEIIGEAIYAYLAGDFPLALENAIEAQARYSLVLSAGWAALAENRSSLARTERIAAVEARANVAAKDVFEKADSLYDAAVDSMQGEYFREAAEQFADAVALYTHARKSTLERRRIAAEAIREANRLIEEQIRAAQEAELNIN